MKQLPLMGLLISTLMISSCGKEEATGKSLDASPKKEVSTSERLFNAETELRRAVKQNDTVSLRRVIFENPDLKLNKYLDDGDTLLVFAIKKKFHLIRNILLEKGAIADLISLQVDFPGQTPLMIAGHLGDSGSIIALLKYNASINAQDRVGDTALHKAIKNGYDDAARTLIRAGADLQIKNDRYESPLETAISLGRTEIMLELEALANLERGVPSIALFRQILQDGDIVNYRKLVRRNPEVIQEYASINPLVITIESTNDDQSFEIAHSLLALKVSPDGPADAETTPLIRAVALKKKNFAELLVRAGAKLSLVDSTDQPALAYAIINIDYATVDLLITNGAPVKITQTENGKKINFRACRLAYSLIRKITDEAELDGMRSILSRLGCGRSR